MATPDVRVRLSAEGVAEVVAALRKIQSEGQSASAKGKRSFLDFNSVLGNTRSLLTGLGVAFGVSQIVSFIRNAGEAADHGELTEEESVEAEAPADADDGVEVDADDGVEVDPVAAERRAARRGFVATDEAHQDIDLFAPPPVAVERLRTPRVFVAPQR